MSQLNSQTINFCLDKLKQTFKKKGITYNHLAEQLGISLATVKRLMSDPSIRFERLLTLCDIAGIAIYQLLEQAANAPASHTEFTTEQDDAFDQCPALLSYFNALVFAGQSPEQIAEQHNLTDAANYLYLRKLEKIGLIELLTENTFKLKISLPVGFSSDSKVLRSQYKGLIEHTVEQVLFTSSSSAYCLVKPMQLSDSLYEKMLDELSNTIDKYAEISELTSNTNEHELRQVMVLSCDAQTIRNEPITNEAIRCFTHNR